MPVDLRLVQARTILTETGGFLSSYSHTLNPYAGCAFGRNGCGVYCYVAESPLGRFGRARWGEWVDAKANAADRLERELARAPDPSRLRVFMSSATDPYQPAEARLRITRALLEVFRRRPIGRLVVQTRSPLVERDLDLLAPMPFVWLSMTVETDDDRVRRALTPACPPIERRLAAMRRARGLGVPVQAALSPLVPHDPERFAEKLDGACDRAVVDTFVSGDGSAGHRTGRRPLPARYRELGWGDWRDESAARRLHDLLATRLGDERVRWSRDGFNAL
ncbi:MAG TPA: radical SAM protein [Chloroflexota bacterium]|jgi:DNA repair photolyase|nr:radical SAM protein [Chloroflexota bacterium]